MVRIWLDVGSGEGWGRSERGGCIHFDWRIEVGWAAFYRLSGVNLKGLVVSSETGDEIIGTERLNSNLTVLPGVKLNLCI